MAIREKINEHKTASIIVVCIVVLATGWLLIGGGSRGEGSSAITGDLSWFTIDDGAHWFADSALKVAPFDHEGKPAYRCYVFTCDGGKTKFVSHLERMTDAARQMIEAARAKAVHAPPEPGLIERLQSNGVEVKRPGESQWISARGGAGRAIQMPKCPNGAGDKPIPVYP